MIVRTSSLSFFYYVRHLLGSSTNASLGYTSTCWGTYWCSSKRRFDWQWAQERSGKCRSANSLTSSFFHPLGEHFLISCLCSPDESFQRRSEFLLTVHPRSWLSALSRSKKWKSERSSDDDKECAHLFFHFILTEEALNRLISDLPKVFILLLIGD